MKKITRYMKINFSVYQFIRFIACTVMLMAFINAGRPLMAQDQRKGEIININYPHETAFSDLNGAYLNVGDIVEIHRGGRKITHLMVSQTTTAISKLVPVPDGPYKTKIQFDDLRVGSEVELLQPKGTQTQISQPMPPNPVVVTTTPQITMTQQLSEAEMKAQASLEEQIKDLSQNYVALSKNLETIIEEKSILMSENQNLKEQLSTLKSANENLELENTGYQAKIQNMSQPVPVTCTNEKKTIRKLENTIFLLKQKLNTMKSIIEGN